MRTTNLLRRQHLWLVLLVALSMSMAACGTGSANDEPDRPLVIATTTILGDIVENLVGDDAIVEVLMPIGADPHEFEPSAQQAARLREADLVVANGLGLEEGLLDTLEAAQEDGVNVLEIGDFLDPVPYEATHNDGEDHGDGDDQGNGKDHGVDAREGGFDAHVWMDPVRMAAAVDIIAARLAGVAGGPFAEKSDAYRAELEALDAEITSMIGTIPQDRRKLVTNHFAYGYYADRYGLELLGTVIPAASTQAQTSAAEFAGLVDLIETTGVAAIFASTTEPTELAEAIAGEVGRDVRVIKLYTGSLGEEGSGAETYIDMMTLSTELIVQGLSS